MKHAEINANAVTLSEAKDLIAASCASDVEAAVRSFASLRTTEMAP
jgi:hypothetical protein